MHTSCSVNLYEEGEYIDFAIVNGLSKNELSLCEKSDECGCEGVLVTMKFRYTETSAALIKLKGKRKRKATNRPSPIGILIKTDTGITLSFINLGVSKIPSLKYPINFMGYFLLALTDMIKIISK